MTTTTPTVLRKGHVGLNVTDLESSKEFYSAVFGLSLHAEGDDPERRWAFLGRDGQLFVTLWQQAAGAFSTTQPGLHHLSFQVSSIEEVRQVEAMLRARSVEILHDGVVPHFEGTGSGGIYFTDPDGIRLEVYAPSGVEGSAPSGDAPTCGFF